MAQPTTGVELIKRIVAKYAPDESELVDVEGETLFQEVLDGKRTETSRETAEEFRFGIEEIVEGIKVLGIIIATAKTVKDLIVAMRASRLQVPTDVATRWQKRLEEEGIEVGLARSIVSEFQADLMAVAEKSQPK